MEEYRTPFLNERWGFCFIMFGETDSLILNQNLRTGDKAKGRDRLWRQDQQEVLPLVIMLKWRLPVMETGKPITVPPRDAV